MMIKISVLPILDGCAYCLSQPEIIKRTESTSILLMLNKEIGYIQTKLHSSIYYIVLAKVIDKMIVGVNKKRI